MRDCAAFLKPIAHRGLHNAAAGLIENTAAAFEAALTKGYGVECDLRPSACGTPIVFHDDTLERLIEGHANVRDLDAPALKRLNYRGGNDAIIDFADLLDLVGGREPILAEIKSDWGTPDPKFIGAIADLARSYRGPLALMSFDPIMVAAFKERAPQVPRGIVSGVFHAEHDWHNRLGAERAFRLTHLLESRDAAPDFYAYHIGALPTPVTRFVREVLGVPLFTWTVKSEEERQVAARWADAPIFEGYEP